MNVLVITFLVLAQVGLTVMPQNSILSTLQKNVLNYRIDKDTTPYEKINTIPYKTVPVAKSDTVAAPILSKAALVYDINSAKVLASRNENEKRSIASLTKVVTAMVILQNHTLDETVTIPTGLNLPNDAQVLNVQPGEQFSLHEALRALLVHSAGDMADSLAIWDAGSVPAFTEKMNAAVKNWGLTESSFTNPDGLDDPNHYSSAHDMLMLTLVTLNSAEFRSVINTERANIMNKAGKVYAVNNTNQLLSVPYIYGVKTGTTALAGESLITLARKDDHELITIVLDSPDRFQESKNMVDWAFANYIWK